MRELKLSEIDMNLLVALDALLQEPNVTKAAARLGVTQPALSHSLRRLRELLGDELLVRAKSGMVLTPRGQEPAQPVRRAMQDLERALGGGPTFDPASAVRTFTVATTDYEGAVVLPQLLELINQQTPGVNLDVRPIDARHAAEQLETGTVDVLIGYPLPPAPGLKQRQLFKEHLICALRRDHPRVQGALDLELYCQLPHLLINPRGESGGIVDSALATLGRTRRVALRVPNFLTAPVVVARSNLILTAPHRLVHSLAAPLQLQLLPPPLELPSFPILLQWHERFDSDQANGWLRQTVLRAVGGGD